jgi:hypothetical protein
LKSKPPEPPYPPIVIGIVRDQRGLEIKEPLTKNSKKHSVFEKQPG